MLVVVFISSCFLFFIYDNLLLFLINYHIYCIYVIIISILLYTNYIFYLKYQYLYLLVYMYLYWFVYINIILTYINILIYSHIFLYNLIILSVTTITFCVLRFKECCFWLFFLFFWVCQLFKKTHPIFRKF